MSNITEAQVNELEVILNSQDRGGFYLKLADVYQNAGASQAAIDQIISQAQITTGSGVVRRLLAMLLHKKKAELIMM